MPGDLLENDELGRREPGRRGKPFLAQFRSAEQAPDSAKGGLGTMLDHIVQLTRSQDSDKRDFITKYEGLLGGSRDMNQTRFAIFLEFPSQRDYLVGTSTRSPFKFIFDHEAN